MTRITNKFQAPTLRAILALAAVFSLTSSSRGQSVLYDDFSGNQIDPAKWIGAGGDQYLRETERTLVPEREHPQGHRLKLAQRAYSDVLTDTNGTGGIFGLAFTRPDSVNDITFRVEVENTSTIACASNPTQETLAGAEFRGRFFNTEIFPGPSSFGDVEAVISLTRHANLGPELHVEALFEHCDDFFCGARTNLGFAELGVTSVGRPTTLHIKWDHPNHQFVFQMNSKASVTLPYTVPDFSPPSVTVKSIDLARVIPNCTSFPRPLASMEAYFDNIVARP